MSDGKPRSTLGFLTVIEHEQQGLFGGYLVLNLAGRPLEFHCTAPIRPNRAQQILYGPTLEPFLFGEQIGQTLLAKARNEPLAVLTDREPALAVREHVETPVALVLPSNAGDVAAQGSSGESPAVHDAQRTWRIDGAHRNPLVAFRVGRNQLAVTASVGEDLEAIADRLQGLAESFDLMEPFSRIREAIEEARRGSP